MVRFACLALLVVAILSPGSRALAEVAWGVKGGLVVSDLRWEEGNPGTDTRKGACVGAYFEWPRSSHITLTGELLYVQKGGKDATGDLRIDCISVPVMVRLEVPTGSGFLYLAAGARVDALLGGDFSGSAHAELEDSLTAVTFGTEVAVGYHFGKALVEVRYSFDVSESIKDGVIGRNDAVSYVLGVPVGSF